MAKADVRKAETRTNLQEWRQLVGRAVERTRTLCCLSLKEFAVAIQRDERQIARWITGAERPQIDALFEASDERIGDAFVVALAEVRQGVEVATLITVRRRA